MQQNRNGMLDYIRNDNSSKFSANDDDFQFLLFSFNFVAVRRSEPNSEQSQNQIYCIDRDHLPRLDYNEVMNQSKESKRFEDYIVDNSFSTKMFSYNYSGPAYL